MEHAFAEAGSAGPRASWTRREVVLVVLCAPAVLLAVWVGCVHHNWDRGLSAVRYSLACERRPSRPLFLVGSAAGLLIVLGITITGSTPTVTAALSEPWIVAVVLLPELAWAGPLALAWVLLPLRAPLSLVIRDTTDWRGAFDPPLPPLRSQVRP